jgi:hypothetical protein
MNDIARLLGRGTSPESSRVLRSVTASQDRQRLERIQQLAQNSRLGRFINRSLLRLGGAWRNAAIIRVVSSQKGRMLALAPARRSRLIGWMLFVIVLTHFALSMDPAREARTHPVILGGVLALSVVLMFAGDALTRAWASRSAKRRINS